MAHPIVRANGDITRGGARVASKTISACALEPISAHLQVWFGTGLDTAIACGAAAQRVPGTVVVALTGACHAAPSVAHSVRRAVCGFRAATAARLGVVTHTETERSVTAIVASAGAIENGAFAAGPYACVFGLQAHADVLAMGAVAGVSFALAKDDPVIFGRKIRAGHDAILVVLAISVVAAHAGWRAPASSRALFPGSALVVVVATLSAVEG